MRRALALLALLLLASGGARAGALWRGYCYANAVEAALAFCAESALPQPVAGIGFDIQQDSSSNGIARRVVLGGNAWNVCNTPTSVVGNVVTIGTHSNLAFVLNDGQTTAGTGTTYPGTMSTATPMLLARGQPTTIAVTFPACTTGDYVNATPADGVELGMAAGAAPLAVAGILFMAAAFRRRDDE